MKWSMPEALQLIAELQPPLASAGYAVGLTGSVLLTGSSDNDLDLVVYPLTTEKEDILAACKALEAVGMRQAVSSVEVTSGWRRNGSRDMKHVEVWTYRGLKVDVFFLK